MSKDTSSQNIFLTAPLGAIFLKTALPIIFVMSMNGLLTVVDAIVLGIYVGTEAVGAVTTVFPIFILTVALATLVVSGMASLLARHLGAGRFTEARGVFAGAHMLALTVAAALILLFVVFGERLVLALTNGPGPLAGMAERYIAIIIFCAPVQFLLAVQSDALRCEGRAGLMAGLSVLVSVANLVLNYVLIALADMGVAGSATATVLAQVLALGLITLFRLFGRTELRLSALLQHNPLTGWSRMIALGSPQSLGFIGMALVSVTIMAALQKTAAENYDTTVAAYGIVTRIMTFALLPLLGLSQAMQAIVGNNVGAGLADRAERMLRLGLLVALAYCLTVEVLLVGFARPIGATFVDSDAVIADVARIMPVMVAMYVLSGPLIMLGSYFQAIGDAGRAAVLGLAKPYLFTMPLVAFYASTFGEPGIWFATPTAEALLLAVAMLVLWQATRRRGAAGRLS
ncbi:MATE family efflux transporter [Ensifer sp. SSB1]|jgi:putative MATE family efflux protein|uniref:MATE family efflux transporter n=1 Tax=Ensifer sp. SSB1 TaxID=2795385 RepID=UPI001A3F6BFA|nr:MATE family efflux transporter [Ensifer sp. SSB1]MBK5569086.1 MATE family efflux transporter [Ensifer sp. SSB1]